MVALARLVADAGYDSESNHRFAREPCGIRALIPPKHGRPTTKPATGRYRRLMQTRFNLTAYHQRAQVETVMSMIKRKQGVHVHGRSYHSQCRDLRLMALTHNAMILMWVRVFYRANGSPIHWPPPGRRPVRASNILIGHFPTTPRGVKTQELC